MTLTLFIAKLISILCQDSWLLLRDKKEKNMNMIQFIMRIDRHINKDVLKLFWRWLWTISDVDKISMSFFLLMAFWHLYTQKKNCRTCFTDHQLLPSVGKFNISFIKWRDQTGKLFFLLREIWMYTLTHAYGIIN